MRCPTAAAVLFVAITGCGGGSSPTEPKAAPTANYSTFSVLNSSGKGLCAGVTLSFSDPVPHSVSMPSNCVYAEAFEPGVYAVSITAGGYQPLYSQRFTVAAKPARNDFTFVLYEVPF